MAETRWDATEDEIRAALKRHGYNPDLSPRGLPGPPGEFDGHRVASEGNAVPVKLRNWVCELGGIGIDGHSDPHMTGMCACCGARLD